jgi:serine/threonine-protein kinase HipA
MAFNAMVTDNGDHPRNHALLQKKSGWRPSFAYDILPFPWFRSSDVIWPWELLVP